MRGYAGLGAGGFAGGDDVGLNNGPFASIGMGGGLGPENKVATENMDISAMATAALAISGDIKASRSGTGFESGFTVPSPKDEQDSASTSAAQITGPSLILVERPVPIYWSDIWRDIDKPYEISRLAVQFIILALFYHIIYLCSYGEYAYIRAATKGWEQQLEIESLKARERVPVGSMQVISAPEMYEFMFNMVEKRADYANAVDYYKPVPWGPDVPPEATRCVIEYGDPIHLQDPVYLHGADWSASDKVTEPQSRAVLTSASPLDRLALFRANVDAARRKRERDAQAAMQVDIGETASTDKAGDQVKSLAKRRWETVMNHRWQRQNADSRHRKSRRNKRARKSRRRLIRRRLSDTSKRSMFGESVDSGSMHSSRSRLHEDSLYGSFISDSDSRFAFKDLDSRTETYALTPDNMGPFPDAKNDSQAFVTWLFSSGVRKITLDFTDQTVLFFGRRYCMEMNTKAVIERSDSLGVYFADVDLETKLCVNQPKSSVISGIDSANVAIAVFSVLSIIIHLMPLRAGIQLYFHRVLGSRFVSLPKGVHPHAYVSHLLRRAFSWWMPIAILANSLSIAVVAYSYEERHDFDSSVAGQELRLLLGLAAFFAFMLLCPTISLFPYTYTILEQTLSKGASLLSQLLIGVFPIYLGFVFFGICQFHLVTDRFTSIGITSQNLFAVMKGDNVLDLFKELQPGGPLIARIYLYAFCLFFLVVVYRLAIAIVQFMVLLHIEEDGDVDPLWRRGTMFDPPDSRRLIIPLVSGAEVVPKDESDDRKDDEPGTDSFGPGGGGGGDDGPGDGDDKGHKGDDLESARKYGRTVSFARSERDFSRSYGKEDLYMAGLPPSRSDAILDSATRSIDGSPRITNIPGAIPAGNVASSPAPVDPSVILIAPEDASRIALFATSSPSIDLYGQVGALGSSFAPKPSEERDPTGRPSKRPTIAPGVAPASLRRAAQALPLIVSNNLASTSAASGTRPEAKSVARDTRTQDVPSTPSHTAAASALQPSPSIISAGVAIPSTPSMTMTGVTTSVPSVPPISTSRRLSINPDAPLVSIGREATTPASADSKEPPTPTFNSVLGTPSAVLLTPRARARASVLGASEVKPATGMTSSTTSSGLITSTSHVGRSASGPYSQYGSATPSRSFTLGTPRARMQVGGVSTHRASPLQLADSPSRPGPGGEDAVETMSRIPESPFSLAAEGAGPVENTALTASPRTGLSMLLQASRPAPTSLEVDATTTSVPAAAEQPDSSESQRTAQQLPTQPRSRRRRRKHPSRPPTIAEAIAEAMATKQRQREERRKLVRRIDFAGTKFLVAADMVTDSEDEDVAIVQGVPQAKKKRKLVLFTSTVPRSVRERQSFLNPEWNRDSRPLLSTVNLFKQTNATSTASGQRTDSSIPDDDVSVDLPETDAYALQAPIRRKDLQGPYSHLSDIVKRAKRKAERQLRRRLLEQRRRIALRMKSRFSDCIEYDKSGYIIGAMDDIVSSRPQSKKTRKSQSNRSEDFNEGSYIPPQLVEAPVSSTDTMPSVTTGSTTLPATGSTREASTTAAFVLPASSTGASSAIPATSDRRDSETKEKSRSESRKSVRFDNNPHTITITAANEDSDFEDDANITGLWASFTNEPKRGYNAAADRSASPSSAADSQLVVKRERTGSALSRRGTRRQLPKIVWPDLSDGIAVHFFQHLHQQRRVSRALQPGATVHTLQNLLTNLAVRWRDGTPTGPNGISDPVELVSRLDELMCGRLAMLDLDRAHPVVRAHCLQTALCLFYFSFFFTEKVSRMVQRIIRYNARLATHPQLEMLSERKSGTIQSQTPQEQKEQQDLEDAQPRRRMGRRIRQSLMVSNLGTQFIRQFETSSWARHPQPCNNGPHCLLCLSRHIYIQSMNTLLKRVVARLNEIFDAGNGAYVCPYSQALLPQLQSLPRVKKQSPQSQPPQQP